MEKTVDRLFWGLVVEQGKQYKQTPKFNFHVSMAVLDLKTADNEPVSVYVQVETGEFILCNLTKSQPQVQLDLIFSEGEKIKFYSAGGKGSVHMTGYVMPEDDFDDMMEDEDFSDEEVSIDSDLATTTNAAAKRKNTDTLKLVGRESKKLKTNDLKAVEKQKVIDVDPKQLLNNKKSQQQDKQQETKKSQKQTNQLKSKPTPNSATKGLGEESEDDDLSIDEDEESVDLNNLNKLMDEEESDLDDLNDEDLESDDDLQSDDDEDIAKLMEMKNKAGKPNQQTKQIASGQKKPFDKPQQQQAKAQHQAKPNQMAKPLQKQNGQQFNKQQNKNSQNHNKSNQNTPHQKSFQKHQQTPFNKGQHNSNKKGTPFNKSANKSFGSQNKPTKKVA